MRAKSVAGTETIIYMRVEGRDSLLTFEEVREVGWKTRERGRHQRIRSNHNRKTWRPSKTVASCERPESGDGRRETGPESAKKR